MKVLSDILTWIKLPFLKERELYFFIHKITGLMPHDIRPYKLALMHRSMSSRDKNGRWLNNERLEYLGDSILDAIIAHYLYDTYPKKREGFLTATRSLIVQRESLNRIGIKMGLREHIQASEQSHKSHNSYICGNALEALVGAVYLDHGYNATRRFIIEKIVKKHFDTRRLQYIETNFKSKLIEWAQKYKVSVDFTISDVTYDDTHSPIFHAVVSLAGIEIAHAEGYSKKESHQHACKLALKRLRKETNLSKTILEAQTVLDEAKANEQEFAEPIEEPIVETTESIEEPIEEIPAEEPAEATPEENAEEPATSEEPQE